MLSKYIQSPYIIFSFGSAKPALIITVIYLLTLIALLAHGIKNNILKVKTRSMSKMLRGEKNKVVFSISGFIIALISCTILPHFLKNDNVIIGVSKTYLQYEILFFLMAFLFLCTSFFNKLNRDKQIIASNKVLNVLIWISMCTGLITGQIDYTFWQNIIVIICAVILVSLYLIIDIESIVVRSDKLNQFDFIPYTPVKKVDELFPRHRMQAEDVANIILNSSSEPFSICISGSWGIGKTSVINGVVDILKQNKDIKNEYIYINALELDTKVAMMNYLFSQIKEKLKSRGVYVGIDSEFKEFISSFSGALTLKSIGDFIHKNFFHENDDYRFQKEKLENVLQRTFGNEKLIVIVDDIERCNEATAREYLFLIKEVATMKNCVSIFVTDYDMLNNLVYKEDDDKESIETSDFLSKFFNYRINLKDELPESVFGYYDSYFNEDVPAFQSIYKTVCMSPGTWYQTVISGIGSKLENEKKQNHYLDEEGDKAHKKIINELETCLSLFNSLIRNSRNVVKFYNVFANNVITCNKLLSSSADENEVKEYIDSRNIGHILYILSFVEVFLPSEYQRFIESGAKYAELPLYGTDDIVSEERALLIELTDGMVYGGYSSVYQKPNGYIKEESRKFINTFLRNKNDLPQLINPFSSQEEKWVDAINKSNESILQSQWTEIVLMVLQKYPYINANITNEWRVQTFSKLLDFAEHQVEIGNWTSDKIFKLFDSDLNTYRLFSIGTGMLQIFWKHLQQSTVYKKPSDALVKEINNFPYHYTYERISHIYRLAHYLIPLESDKVRTNNLQEHMLNINRKYSENVSIFLDKLADCIEDFSLTSESWDKKYNELTNRIAEDLKKLGLSEYPDVHNETELMIDSLEELLSLDKIINWAGGTEASSNETVPTFETGNIEQTIQFFERIFDSDYEDKEGNIERQFPKFFEWLQNTSNLVINEQQLGRLHQLVTIYVEKTAYSSIYFRRVLLKIAANQNKKVDGE